MDTTERTQQRRVRTHPAELRARVLTLCDQPGASVARVAREHGLNANLVHTWRRQQRRPAGVAVQGGGGSEFVPIALPQPEADNIGRDIRLELRRGGTEIKVSWPSSAAAECAAWLTQWLR